MTDARRAAVFVAAGLAALACVTSAWAASPAPAAPAARNDRYAIVIGSNRGEPDEDVLRFAERDAQRMGEVLVRLGGVAPEDLVVLPTPSRGGLERALAALRLRIRDPAQALVFVYYSGHADAQALHLSGERYRFGELKRAVRDLGAAVSVFLVDACRSGGLVRTKGGTPTEAFAFEVEDRLAAEGMAIITSSAENEDAQESDHLAGGVFTHHLVTGLIGAADTSRDDRVTLAEAFRYAYAQTLATTSTSRIVQHPTYAFDITGQEEIVVTRLAASAERGRLLFRVPGSYLVLEARGLPLVVAELEGRGAGTELSLSPGDYLVRRREPAAVFESKLQVAANRTTTVDAESMARVPFRHAVRKGYRLADPQVLSLGVDGELASELLDGTGALVGVAVTAQIDWADIAVRTRLRYAQSDTANAHVALSQALFGVDVGIFHVFDLGDHGVGFGLRGGIDWLRQSFETRGTAPDTDQAVGRLGPFGRIELALGGSLALQLDVGVEVYLLEAARNATGTEAELEARVVPTVNLGLSFVLP